MNCILLLLLLALVAATAFASLPSKELSDLVEKHLLVVDEIEAKFEKFIIAPENANKAHKHQVQAFRKDEGVKQLEKQLNEIIGEEKEIFEQFSAATVSQNIAGHRLSRKPARQVNNLFPPGSIIRTISDSHVTDPRGWNYDKSGNQLAQFKALIDECLDKSSNVTSLVLMGDIVELWSKTKLRESPPLAQQVFAEPDVQEIFAKVRQLAESGVQVIYLNGNHDDTVTERDVKAFLGDKVIFFSDEAIVTNNIVFTHGSWEEYFNSLSPLQYDNPTWFTDKILSQPIGYYMARLNSNSVLSGLFEVLDEQEGEEKFYDDIYTPVLDKLGWSKCFLSFDCTFHLVKTIGVKAIMRVIFAGVKIFYWKFGKEVVTTRNNDGQLFNVTLREVDIATANQYAKYSESVPFAELFNMMIAMLSKEYKYEVTRQTEGKLVVHGHVHRARLTSYKRSDGSLVYYLNDGSFGMPKFSLFSKKVSPNPITFGQIEVLTETSIKASVREMVNGKSIPFKADDVKEYIIINNL